MALLDWGRAVCQDVPFLWDCCRICLPYGALLDWKSTAGAGSQMVVAPPDDWDELRRLRILR